MHCNVPNDLRFRDGIHKTIAIDTNEHRGTVPATDWLIRIHDSR